MARPVDQMSQEGGEKRGDRFDLQKWLRDRQRGAKLLAELRLITTCPPYTYMGWHQRKGREAEDLGWTSPPPSRRVRGAAAPSTQENTPSGDWKGARRRRKRSSIPCQRRLGMEEQGARARAGQNVLFPCPFLLFLFSGGLGRRRSGIGNAGLGQVKAMYEKPAAVASGPLP